MEWLERLAPYFLTFIGGSGALWIFLQFIGKKIIEQKFSKEMENHRSELAQKVEVLKSQLSIFCHEQMISISRIDKDRAEAIKEVYYYLIKWAKIAGKLIAKADFIDNNEGKVKYYISHITGLSKAYCELSECAQNRGCILMKILTDALI